MPSLTAVAIVALPSQNVQRAFLFTLLLLSTSFLQTTQADSTISIGAQPAWSSVHPCVQECLSCHSDCQASAGGLNWFLSAQNLDSLYCRTDLQSSASSYLTKCLNSLCTTNAVDLQDGTWLYNGYCHVNGATLDNSPPLTASTASSKTSSIPPSETSDTNMKTSTAFTTVDLLSTSPSSSSPPPPSPAQPATTIITSTVTAASPNSSSSAPRSSECRFRLSLNLILNLISNLNFLWVLAIATMCGTSILG